MEAADGEVPVWDPTVRFFRLYRNGELKAHFYLDPYARPGGWRQSLKFYLWCLGKMTAM